MTFKNLLFPTDFSQAALAALPHALELSKKNQAEMTILHVATPHSEDPTLPEYQYLEKGDYEGFLRARLEEISRTPAQPREVETALVRGISPAAGILDFIGERGIDLTIMGTHGRSALTHFFVGSVAEKVVRHAACPVLTVAPDRQEYRSNAVYQNILVAFDFSDHSKEAARLARTLAGSYGARVQALYVIEQEVHPAFYHQVRASLARDLPRIADRARQALSDSMGEDGLADIKVHVEIGEGKAHREISTFARAHQIDLIVMGTHGLSGVERVLLGSTTERMVRIAPCPVLTVKLESA